jgi:succinate-semialdehyde dehydrogenase/glutarate-semialdehyde dehydrogenase
VSDLAVTDTWKHRGSLIGDEVRDTGEWKDVLDPSTGEPAAAVHAASVDDCLDAVEAAAAAAADWARTAPRERSAVLRRAFELTTARADALAELIVLEQGKAYADAKAEVLYAAEFFRWFSEEAVRIGGELRNSPAGDKRIMTTKEPVGVSLLITPWNFPAAMATRKIGPALAAGCTCVVKPASETPLTTYAIADILREAGAPAGVVNVVTPASTGKSVKAMMGHPAVRAVSFTGSTEVGSILLEQAAPRVLKCSMELGGNAPLIVWDDADVDLAVEGAFVAKMRNGGASCIAANRLFVHTRVKDRFVEGFVAKMKALRLGPGLDRSTTLGPMVSEAECDRVAALVAGAIDGGATALTGGKPVDGPGFFYPATVLDDVDRADPILTTEIFGPVAAIIPFDDDDDVVAMANDTDTGLASYVFSSDLGRALRTAEGLQIGMVGINRGLISDPAAPFGGVKVSGLGREGAHEGIEEFLETKYIAVEWDQG